ncbi:hypothetical protein PRIPAC_90950 [Pristionchus pacificus]|nr:hypothetical protein PRIPAC_90950 [Pristionchus pacificus]
MTIDNGVATNNEEDVDDEYTHGCCCCEMHVEKAAIVLGVIYFVVELYAVWNHFSDGNPTFPLCFFAVSGLLVFGIGKRNRTALLVFLILLTAILLVEGTMCFLEIPVLIDDIKGPQKADSNITKTSTEAPEIVLTYAVIKFAHLALRIAIGAYLYKVLLNFRRYILESPSPQRESPLPVVTAIRLEDYTAIRMEDAPPAYTSAD